MAAAEGVELRLLGEWLSPYCIRVKQALAVKGVAGYEYVEEDLEHKSELLLSSNPVHGKVPVLIHRGAPVCESLVIVQYVDEAWAGPAILPSDPYERSRARFWAAYIDDKAPVASDLGGIRRKPLLRRHPEEVRCRYCEVLRLVVMSGGGYWTDLVTGFEGVRSLDEFSFPMTQETHTCEDVQLGASVEEHEVQAVAGAEVVEVQSSAGGNKRPRVPRPNAKRQKNFIPDEDVIVVSAWLNVSKDPVQGANQSHSSFWRRIYDYYETHRKSFASRTESSLMHRWMYILENVNKYCACYDAIERRNQSGKTIHDKVSEALTMFQGINGEKTFTLMQCWNILKDEEKWKAKRRELAELKQAGNKKKKVRPDSTPTNVQVNITEDVTEIAPPESEARKRPQGQKKAKDALRRGGGEACMEALDKMWAKKEAFDMEKEKKKEERHMASLELEKRRLALEEKKVEAELRKVENDTIEKEEKIMAMDISALTPLQQQYYTVMQQKIVDRRLAN